MTSMKQFWKGKLYRRCLNENADGLTPPERRSLATGCISVFRIEALPFPGDIQRAVFAAPAAEADLRAWQSAWHRSFPGWEEGKAAQTVLSKLEDASPNRGSIEAISKDIEEFLGRDQYAPALTAFAIEKRTRAVVPAVSDPTPEAVIVARTLRAANAFSALVRLQPFTTALQVTIDGTDAGMAVLTGFTEDGMPILSNRYGNEPRLDGNLDNMFRHLGRETSPAPAFWTWDFLWDELGRTVFGVSPSGFEASERENDRLAREHRRIALAGAIADMASQGTTHAVFSPRDANGTAKALTLEIGHIETIQAALDMIDNVGIFTWSATVEPLERYISVNRYFFHGGRLIGSTCVDPTSHPYDSQCRDGFDKRLTSGASALIEDGEVTISDEADLDAHDEYARKIGDLLRERGVLDFALDVGMLDKGESGGPIQRSLRVLSVGDLWSAQTYSFDQTILAEIVLEETEDYSRKLDVALDAVANHPDFGRLAPSFREVVEAYGRGTMVARLIKRSSSIYRGAWNEEHVKDVIDEALAHYVLSSTDDFTVAEEEAAQGLASFLQYDGFHEWVWKHWGRD
jgi:hypothetical protein